MELALIVIVGGLSWWLMQPLRDWYVVEVSHGTGGDSASIGKQVFLERGAAEQLWVQRVQEMQRAGGSGEVFLWHVEARSRRQVLSGKLPEGKAAVLLKSQQVRPLRTDEAVLADR